MTLLVLVAVIAFFIGSVVGIVLGSFARNGTGDYTHYNNSFQSLSDRSWNQVNDPVLLYLKEKDRNKN